MDTIFIVGVETVVGANLAATLSRRNRVIGLTEQPDVAIDGCDVSCGQRTDLEASREWLDSVCPSRVICCTAAISSWDNDCQVKQTDVDTVRSWAIAASELEIPFTLISSDGGFTGPWLFHREACHSLCESPQANIIREMESAAQSATPNTLIIRTHAFGFSPLPTATGWLETTLAKLDYGTPIDVAHTCHATPIYAGHLAEMIEAAFDQELQGVYHIAGAERVNPLQFTVRLADAFGYSAPSWNTRAALEQRPVGFGRSEHSLDTRKIRRTLGVGMPMLREGIDQLLADNVAGVRDCLKAGSSVIEKVA